MSKSERMGIEEALMTDSKYDKLRVQLLRCLATDGQHINLNLHINLHKRIKYRQALDALSGSRVPALGEAGSESSALNPVSSDMWCIGSFGSVWLDTTIGGVACRVSFNPANEEFFVDESG